MSPARFWLSVAVASALLVASGCADEDPGAPHPTDRLDYPIGVTADPRGEVIWVTSGNFDLAYRGGAVLAIDVRTNQFIDNAAFQVGGFPGEFVLLERDGDVLGGYILSRDEDALYHVSIAGPADSPVVSCDGREATGDTILHCPVDEALHTVKDELSDGEPFELVVGNDPYGALVRKARTDAQPDLLLTGSMVEGNLASFELDGAGAPTLKGNLDLFNGLFSMAESPSNGLIYTSSKLNNVFHVLDVAAADDDSPETNPYVRSVGQIVVPEALASDRARALAVSLDGTRLYASYRSPDSLLIIDISTSAAGDPANRVIVKVPLSRDPGDIVVLPGIAPGTERVYVACFEAGRVEVVDPASGQVVDSIRTGRGPYGMDAIINPTIGIQRLYVSLFFGDSVGVIELDPSSPYYHTLVAEIR